TAADRPFAWLTITEEDNDPSSLLAYIALALDSVEPLDRQTFSALTMSQADLASIRLPRLGNVLANRSLPFLLVLDDVHLIHDSRSIELIEVLAGDMPHGSHLVLAGRSDPPFSLSRMLANGGLLRIGVEELTMAEHEAEALLGQAEVQID